MTIFVAFLRKYIRLFKNWSVGNGKNKLMIKPLNGNDIYLKRKIDIIGGPAPNITPSMRRWENGNQASFW